MIETDRLILRAPAPDDLPWLLGHLNTPAVMRHVGGDAHPECEMRDSLSDDIAAWDAPHGHRRWTVTARHSGAPLGRVGLFRIRSEAAPARLRGQPEIGWTFAEPHWGQGFATEAARAALRYAFGERAMPQVFSQTSESNAPSTRMMHRLGFTARPEFSYVDPGYPARDNPTTVWSLAAEAFDG